MSLRFSCPSVVQNLGQPVAQQRQSLEKLAGEIVPSNYKAPDAPLLFAGQSMTWPDVMVMLAFIERGLSDETVGFTTRLLRVLGWLDLLDKAPPEAILGDQLGNLLPVLHEASARALPGDDLPLVKPTALGRVLFRQWTAQLLRHDTDVTARGGLLGRMRLLGDGLRFTLGRGRVPALADPVSVRVAFSRGSTAAVESGAVVRADLPKFSRLEHEFGGRNEKFNNLFVRYFRVKLQGLHFCGRAFYDMPFIDGFRSLALMYPTTLCVARLRAARDGR